MPPPPHEMVIISFFIKVLIVSASWMSIGLGLGTTLRQPRPASSLKIAPACIASLASASVKNGPIGFVGFLNASSAGSTTTCVKTVATCFLIPALFNS